MMLRRHIGITRTARQALRQVRPHDHVPGSGIGLYMVKITGNACGTIAVHSQPGLGTTFVVTLPE